MDFVSPALALVRHPREGGDPAPFLTFPIALEAPDSRSRRNGIENHEEQT